jgi:hypothetical protein
MSRPLTPSRCCPHRAARSGFVELRARAATSRLAARVGVVLARLCLAVLVARGVLVELSGAAIADQGRLGD